MIFIKVAPDLLFFGGVKLILADLVEKIIISKKYGTKSDIEKIDIKVKAIIRECEEFAESSPFPDKSVMYDVVYEQKDYPFINHKID